MATYRCEVVTPWNTDMPGFNEQGVALDYPAVWSDVTGQPDENLVPDPNVFVSRGEGLSDAQMTALEADARYVVLWSEAETVKEPASRGLLVTRADEQPQVDPIAVKPPTEKPTQAEHGKLVADLARLGVGGSLVSDLARTNDRKKNADLLRAKLKALPKAKEPKKV
jgi:hypothetical protein